MVSSLGRSGRVSTVSHNPTSNSVSFTLGMSGRVSHISISVVVLSMDSVKGAKNNFLVCVCNFFTPPLI